MSGQRDLEREIRAFQDKISSEQQTKEMAEKKAKEKKVKRTEFLLDLLKAIIVALATILIEHLLRH